MINTYMHTYIREHTQILANSLPFRGPFGTVGCPLSGLDLFGGWEQTPSSLFGGYSYYAQTLMHTHTNIRIQMLIFVVDCAFVFMENI